MKASLFFLLALVLLGCQSRPTTAMEESVNVFSQNTILVDTRSALNFESFHIEGSVSIKPSDFIVTKNPTAKKRFHKKGLESDFNAIISRLAAKGIHPNHKIILLAEKKEALSQLRMKWLLQSLEVDRVQLYSLDQFMKEHPGRFSQPAPQTPWTLKSSEIFQKEFIFDKAEKCFINVKKWNASACSGKWN